MGSRLVNSFFQNLSGFGFLIKHQLFRILWLIHLPFGRVDTELTEHALHTKSTRFVRYDGYDMRTKGFIFEQHTEDTVKRHGGRDFPLSATGQNGVKSRQFGNGEFYITVATTLRDKTTQMFPALTHVEHLRAISVRSEIRETLQFIILDR